LIADVNRSWSEGFGARNVIVRDNKFESLNCNGAQDGAAVYMSATINDTPSHYPLLGNLLFENNVFSEMTGPAIEAASFKDVIIRNNRFINRETVPINLKMRGSIRAELGSGLSWTPTRGKTPEATMKVAKEINFAELARRALLQSISEAAATASGWSNRQPAFYPKWVEKVEATALPN